MDAPETEAGSGGGGGGSEAVGEEEGEGVREDVGAAEEGEEDDAANLGGLWLDGWGVWWGGESLAVDLVGGDALERRQGRTGLTRVLKSDSHSLITPANRGGNEGPVRS